MLCGRISTHLAHLLNKFRSIVIVERYAEKKTMFFLTTLVVIYSITTSNQFFAVNSFFSLNYVFSIQVHVILVCFAFCLHCYFCRYGTSLKWIFQCMSCICIQNERLFPIITIILLCFLVTNLGLLSLDV